MIRYYGRVSENSAVSTPGWLAALIWCLLVCVAIVVGLTLLVAAILYVMGAILVALPGRGRYRDRLRARLRPGIRWLERHGWFA